MSVPLDNLYHYVESQLKKPATLYLFLPHGSKKLTDLSILRHYTVEQTLIQPSIICHDQEPLLFELHEDHQPAFRTALEQLTRDHKKMVGPDDWLFLSNLNLQLGTYIPGVSIYDQAVLLHSELNSQEVEKYQAAGFECAYYWSHAFIARDWFRFAQFDIRNRPTGIFDQMFLIYSRGWTNSREYRLKFIEMLFKYGLYDSSKISIAREEEGICVQNYQFKNPNFELEDPTFLNEIPECIVSADASADYDFSDISKSIMSVVLETMFDDSRIHLTEKTLRPIACGHPFIIAAGPGSLEYLRSYGFKTFDGFIDESYDLETDPVRRLEKICDAMYKIKRMSVNELESWYAAVREITIYNRQHFFSSNFWNYITKELSFNLNTALDNIAATKGHKWRENRKRIRQIKPQHWQIQLQHDHERIKAQALRVIRGAGKNEKSL